MENVELDVDNEYLSKVMDTVDRGKYRIPEFQRGFVWDRSDVISLFDSIYNSYPIGSFFFWKVPQSMFDFFRDVEGLDQPPIDEIKSSGFPEVNFVLDGQQRLTSLYIALNGITYNGIDYSKIVFDLDEEEFKVAEGRSDHLVRLCDIWDDRREIRDELTDERRSTFIDCYEVLRQYELPLIVVESENIESVIDIFERINQKGTRLSRFDIVNANIWSREFNIRNKIGEDLFPELDRIGFGNIDRGRVTQTFALIHEQTCTTSAQKNLDTDEVKQDWPTVKDSIVEAIRYLQNKHGVRRAEFIPYEGMIPVLSYYIFKNGGKVDSSHQEIIDKWFWRVAISRRYSSQEQTRMAQDAKFFDKLLGGKEVEVDYAPDISKEEIINENIKHSTSGLRNAFLCLLCKKNPLHFETGAAIDFSRDYYTNFNLSNHHIFPNRSLREKGYSQKERKSITDITFIPADVNKKIRSEGTSGYFSSLRREENFDEVMSSHLIPADGGKALWEEDYDQFREERAEMIFAEFMDLIGEYSGLESDLETDPESAVDEIETRIRDYIFESLNEKYNEENVWEKMPGDVMSNVERRIQDEEGQDPEFSISGPREKLDYCDVGDYPKIINKNWRVFKSDFPSKQEVDERFQDFGSYRHSFAHNRGTDKFTELDGKISIQWIDSCIEIGEAIGHS